MKKKWITAKEIIESGAFSFIELTTLCASGAFAPYSSLGQRIWIAEIDKPMVLSEYSFNAFWGSVVEKDDDEYEPALFHQNPIDGNPPRLLFEINEKSKISSMIPALSTMCFTASDPYILHEPVFLFDERLASDLGINGEQYVEAIMSFKFLKDDIENYFNKNVGSEKSLHGSKEVTYKKLLAALLKKSSIPPSAHNAVSTIKTEIDKLGFGLDEDTIRKYLKQIQEFVDTKKPNKI